MSRLTQMMLDLTSLSIATMPAALYYTRRCLNVWRDSTGEIIGATFEARTYDLNKYHDVDGI